MTLDEYNFMQILEDFVIKNEFDFNFIVHFLLIVSTI